MAMRGFAGIAQPAPQPAPSVAPPPPPIPDVMAEVARINAEAMGEPEPAQPEKRGGIFGRLSRKPAPASPALDTKPDAAASGSSTGNGAMPVGGLGDTSIFGTGLGASMGDASMDVSMDAGAGDAEMGIDPALAAQAFPEEHRSTRRLSPVVLGWLALLLVVAAIIATLVLAPSAVVSTLPGATRLYALFGIDTGAQSLAFEGVRYGWASEGGQTVLEVQGDVVNTSSAPVNVPTVVIALRDESGAEISQWTTEVGEEQLAAGEHAPFLRQIPAPPSNVRSVKVGFAKAE
jgi:hypothetical protein